MTDLSSPGSLRGVLAPAAPLLPGRHRCGRPCRRPTRASVAASTRRRVRGLPALLLSGALLAAACGGGDGGTGPDEAFPQELVGRWEANPTCQPQGCFFTVFDPATPADSLNLASGVSISMLVQSTGRVILTIQGFPSLEGDARVAGNRLYVTGAAKTDTATWSLTSGRLRLDFLSHFDNFDVDGDDVADVTRARAVFFPGS